MPEVQRSDDLLGLRLGAQESSEIHQLEHIAPDGSATPQADVAAIRQWTSDDLDALQYSLPEPTPSSLSMQIAREEPWCSHNLYEDRSAHFKDQWWKVPYSAARDTGDTGGDEAEQKPHTESGLAKCRKGLPLLFQSTTGARELITKYDSGTHDNHMSLDLATEMGYEIDTSEASRGSFQLPTGKIIEAIGRVSAQVRFAKDPDHEDGRVICFFNVFSRLASPVLIGMTFLKATETITKYTQRLVDLPPSVKRSFSLCAVGNATNRVCCIIDGRDVVASADTGSELALMSGAYAARHGLLREYSCEVLELADGSLEYTSGFADVVVQVKDRTIFGKETFTKKMVRFHVLKHLQFDVLLDEDAANQFDIFRKGLVTLASKTSGLASLAPIVWLGSAERKVAKTVENIKDRVSSIFSKTPEQDNTATDTASALFARWLEVLTNNTSR